MAKVKICGITNEKDALNAAKLGADYIGFNFYKKSPRYIDEKKAKEIINKIPARIKKVGVFVNEDADAIIKISKNLGLDLIQLHGDETLQYCKKVKKQAKIKIIKAFRIKDKKDVHKINHYKDHADYFMFDAYTEKLFGGTGKIFDWHLVNGIKKPFFLSGGLNPENVFNAILISLPFAVDVASGVEKKPGKKDYNKIKKFIEAAK